MAKNKESYLGKTACYDKCEIEHQCFGGYTNEDPVCEGEMGRIKRALENGFPGQDIGIRSSVKKGIFFVRGDGTQCIVQNENGVWVERDVAIRL